MYSLRKLDPLNKPPSTHTHVKSILIQNLYDISLILWKKPSIIPDSLLKTLFLSTLYDQCLCCAYGLW